MWYHFVCDIIACGHIVMVKVSTHDNHADMRMKIFPIAKFEHCLDWLVFIVKFSFGVYGRGEEFFLKIVVFFFHSLHWNSCQDGDC